MPDKAAIRAIVKEVARKCLEDNYGQKVKIDRSSLEILVNNLSRLLPQLGSRCHAGF